MATRPSRGLHWGALFRVDPGRPAIGTGLRVAAAITVPLAIGLGAGHLTMGAAISLGALNVAMVDSGGPERTRVAVLSTATVVNAGVFALGIVAAHTLGLAVPLMFAVAFAGGLLTVYGRVASIVGFVTTVVYTLGLGFPPGQLTAPEALWLALVGGAWAMILALGLWPLRPYAAAQNAVAACYVAVGRMVAGACAPGTSAATTGRASRSARDALGTAHATLRATRFGRDGESAPGRILAALTESAGVLLEVSEGLAEDLIDRGRLGSTATLVREVGEHMGRSLRSVGSAVRAGGPSDLTSTEAAVSDLSEVVGKLRAEVSRGAGDATELAALRPVISSFRHLMNEAGEAAALAAGLHGGALGPSARRLVGPAGAVVDGTRRRGRADPWVVLTRNLTFDSVAFRHALRYATVTAIGVLLFLGLDLPKGYWVALTIAVILKPFAGITLQRTLLRIGGTILGALLAVAITASVRSDWGTVLVMVPLAIVGFSLQPFNYGLWVIFFTPLVILTTEVAHPGQWTLAGWRIADTLIGAALALAGSYLLWPESSRPTARRELVTAVTANRAYFCAVMRRYVWPGPTTEGLGGPHRAAALAADNVEADLQRLLGERPRGGDLVARYWRLVGSNRGVYGALTALESHLRTFTGRHRLPGLPELCHGLDAALGDLASALGADRPPAPLPALDAALAAVRDHLAEVELARAGERAAVPAGPGGRPADTDRTRLVEELRDESLVAVEAERLVRRVTAMHSALAGG